MKFKIQCGLLIEALKKVLPAVPKKTTLPILTHVCMIVSADGKLELTSTNLDVTLRYMVDVEVEEPGSATIEARQLDRILSVLPSEETIELVQIPNESGITLICGDKKIQEISHDTCDFPVSPKIDDTVEAVVSKAHFLRVLDICSSFTAKNELRPALTGVFLQFNKKELRATGTNGHILYECILPIDYDGESLGVILPRATCEIIAKSKLTIDSLRISVNDKYISIDLDGLFMQSRLIDSKYPQYQSMIPTDDPSGVLEIDRESFIANFKLARLSASAISKLAVLNLQEKVSRISSSDMLLNRSVKETLTGSYEGTNLDIGLDADLAIAGFGKMPCNTLRCEFRDKIKPVIVKFDDKTSEVRYICLLMPMRIEY